MADAPYRTRPSLAVALKQYFEEGASLQKKSKTFIVKPKNESQGIGISLVQSMNLLEKRAYDREPLVVQCVIVI